MSASRASVFNPFLLALDCPACGATCDLSAIFASLMSAPLPPPRIEEAPVAVARAAAAAPAPADRSPKNSTLRRAALQPGKTLARKTPLTRKTPLRLGTWSKPRS